MDPNTTWSEMCGLAERMQKREDDTTGTLHPAHHIKAQAADGERMAELALALRDWMAKGGFPPRAFQK